MIKFKCTNCKKTYAKSSEDLIPYYKCKKVCEGCFRYLREVDKNHLYHARVKKRKERSLFVEESIKGIKCNSRYTNREKVKFVHRFLLRRKGFYVKLSSHGKNQYIAKQLNFSVDFVSKERSRRSKTE